MSSIIELLNPAPAPSESDAKKVQQEHPAFWDSSANRPLSLLAQCPTLPPIYSCNSPGSFFSTEFTEYPPTDSSATAPTSPDYDMPHTPTGLQTFEPYSSPDGSRSGEYRPQLNFEIWQDSDSSIITETDYMADVCALWYELQCQASHESLEQIEDFLTWEIGMTEVDMVEAGYFQEIASVIDIWSDDKENSHHSLP